jgi:hypothetical protein
MRWLLNCQRSGLLRQLLRLRGHDAWTCDLEPAEDGSEFHIQGDAIKAAYMHTGNTRDETWKSVWDGMIAMPECRFLSSSGQHRTGKPGQRSADDVDAAAGFFMRLMLAPISRIAVENSIGIMSTRYRKPDQIIQPHQFGEDASKATCLWLKNLPRLIGTEIAPPRTVKYRGKTVKRWANQTDSGQNRLGPSATRSFDRARTYPGIARAMDAQWGILTK